MRRGPAYRKQAEDDNQRVVRDRLERVRKKRRVFTENRNST